MRSRSGVSCGTPASLPSGVCAVAPAIELQDVRVAQRRLRGVAHHTPVLRSRTLDELTGARVALKAENLQRGGAFKFRGAEASDDVRRSLAAGERVRVQVGPTIADGQQTPVPGELTWPVIRRLVDSVVTVSDAQIVDAMRFLLERCKLAVEPSGASALAALLAGTVPALGARVGVVLSGGNIGAPAFAALMG